MIGAEHIVEPLPGGDRLRKIAACTGGSCETQPGRYRRIGQRPSGRLPGGARGQQLLIAQRSGGRIGDADHPAHHHRHVDGRAQVGFAFGLVAIQQCLWRTVGHRRQFPGEVRGIAQARTQALPGKRRGLVRGVAGQQHPALAPLLGDAGAEGIDRRALERNRAMHIPRLEQARNRGFAADLRGSFAGQDHEFPAVAAFAHQDAGGRAGRVADLQVGVGQPRIVLH